jgi:hypothetical protein
MERSMSTLAPELVTEAPSKVGPQAAQAALRAFWKIAELWKLSEAERMTILGLNPETYRLLGAARQLPHDLIERISYILGIFKNLEILLPAEAADQWIRRPNRAPVFNGRSALDRMLSGNVSDLYVVRKYLDAQTQG